MAKFLWKFKDWIIPRQKFPEHRNTENDAILIPKLPDVQPGFEEADHGESKGVPEKQLLQVHWLTKAFDCVDHN